MSWEFQNTVRKNVKQCIKTEDGIIENWLANCCRKYSIDITRESPKNYEIRYTNRFKSRHKESKRVMLLKNNEFLSFIIITKKFNLKTKSIDFETYCEFYAV